MRGKETHGWVRGDKNSQDLQLRGQKLLRPTLRGPNSHDLNWGVGQIFHQTWIEGTKSHGTWTEGDQNSQVLLCLRGQKSQDLKMRGQNYSRNHLHSGDIISRFLSPQFAGPELRWQETRHLKSPHHHAVCSCSRVREGVSLSLSLSLSCDRPAIPCKSFLSRTQFGHRLQFLYAQLQSQNAHQTAQCRKQLISK